MQNRFFSLFSTFNVNGFFSFVALFFFVFFFVFPGFYKIYAYLISLFGVFAFFFCYSKIDKRPVLPLLSLFIMVSLADIFNYAIGMTSLSDFEKVARNVLLIFPFLVFSSISLVRPVHLLMAGTGLFWITLIFALLQHYGFYAQDASHYNRSNPGLWFNKGSFSTAVVLFFALFSGLSLQVSGRLSKLLFLTSLLAVSSLLYLTQARGPALGFVFVLLFMCFMWLHSLDLPRNILIGMSVVMPVMVLVLLFVGFGSRLSIAWTELVQHFSVGSQYTSVSIRIDTWKIAWDVFLGNPLLGAGAQGADAIKESLVALGKYPDYILKFHAHSEYFMTLERGGLIGIFGLFWMLIFPLVSLNKLGVKLRNMSPVFMVIGAFMVIGITSATLRNNIGANSFIFALLAAYFFSYKYYKGA